MLRLLTGAALGSMLAVASYVSASERSPTPEEWRARQIQAADRSERIMKAAEGQKSLLARYEYMLDAAQAGDRDAAFRLIFGQYLSWYQTFVGDYPDAAASFSIEETLRPGDHPSPLGLPGERAQPAVEAIAQLARSYKAVFFNEAHHLPLTRTLTVQLLAKLRAEGFDTFAAETLYDSDSALAKRGYPIDGTGFYTEEPICAEMVRSALKLGFKVVSYEVDDNRSGDARERAQARNLYQRVFKQNRSARLVVDAGYAHIAESGAYLGGASMAEHLHRIADIDPLTVEQTMLIPHPAASQNHPYYNAIVQQLHPTEPIVFEDAAGKPWSLRDGYDVSVVFPLPALRRGRPTWLALGGLRTPYFVGGNITCKNRYPCLVEARYATEGDDAIPADRMVFDPIPELEAQPIEKVRPANGATAGELYLRPGQYRLSASDAEGRTLSRQTITVTAPAAAREGQQRP